MTRSLEFTLTISKCLGCHFCPQDKLGQAYADSERIMSMESFETILSKLPKGMRCDASGYSEPFLNRNAAAMLSLAVERGHETYLYSTLMGLSKEQADILSKIRLTFVRIHLPDATGFKTRPATWLRQFELFLATGQEFSAMAMSRDVAADIVAALDKAGVEILYPDMLSRGGNLWKPQDISGQPMRCTFERWSQNVCLPNGDVYGCCMDYGLSVPLGNLIRQSYAEIQEAAENWRKRTEPAAVGICATCEWAAAL